MKNKTKKNIGRIVVPAALIASLLVAAPSALAEEKKTPLKNRNIPLRTRLWRDYRENPWKYNQRGWEDSFRIGYDRSTGSFRCIYVGKDWKDSCTLF